ncbi:arylsulfatase [Maribellus sediminis]|uniref:arylsulfatase n=1 Tax=Maribellus sediminis TaxID=2696285 RepID=UPI00142F4AB9|nr:arylsulfatase [Maribellus sediminis]
MKNLILLLLASLFFNACTNKQSPSKPNIVIILSDDQAWGDLSINGNTNIETPNIDKLAETGVTFDRFYVCAVCSPTRAELLTGRYHVRGGVYSTSSGGERLDTDETTIAEVFKSAGYATAAYGKWHNGMQAPYHPNSRGFDDFYGFCSGHWGNYFSPMLEHNGDIVKGNGFTIDDFTDHGLQFMEDHKDQPFFLYLPFNTPHSPMQAPKAYWDKFEHKELSMFHRDKEKEDIDFTRAALAMCENIDWNVGRITRKIEELGLAENTIVIYLSDNGPNDWRWNGGMKGKKGSTDEGGVRSPMIMNWSGVLPKGKVIKQIAGAIDLFPTLSELSGIELNTPKQPDGKSLKTLLLDENPEWDDRILVNYWAGKTSVRSQKFRLDQEDRLFDMENDPGQSKNVAQEFPEAFKRLSTAKESWKKDVLSELDPSVKRPFTIGHTSMEYTQLPARDAVPHGNILRSNKHPNCTYFTNWTNINDTITFDVEVLNSGTYEVELFYTCPPEDIGSAVRLSYKGAVLDFLLSEAFDPPLKKDTDIYPRMEGYVKDFKRTNIGSIHLTKGTGELSLQATKIPGRQVMDFRLLLLKKINEN